MGKHDLKVCTLSLHLFSKLQLNTEFLSIEPALSPFFLYSILSFYKAFVMVKEFYLEQPCHSLPLRLSSSRWSFLPFILPKYFPRNFGLIQCMPASVSFILFQVKVFYSLDGFSFPCAFAWDFITNNILLTFLFFSVDISYL